MMKPTCINYCHFNNLLSDGKHNILLIAYLQQNICTFTINKHTSVLCIAYLQKNKQIVTFYCQRTSVGLIRIFT